MHVKPHASLVAAHEEQVKEATAKAATANNDTQPVPGEQAATTTTTTKTTACSNGCDVRGSCDHTVKQDVCED